MSRSENKMAQAAQSTAFDVRVGERRLDIDPASMPADASLVFIGRVSSPWTRREDCPKNMAQARERGVAAQIRIDPAFRDGLAGLDGYSHLVLLTWLNHAPRDLIVQKPRHASEPRGTFALRSPVRPNPIGLHVCAIISVDAASGVITIDGIDVLDGTPVIDLKPYFASTDAISSATSPERK